MAWQKACGARGGGGGGGSGARAAGQDGGDGGGGGGWGGLGGGRGWLACVPQKAAASGMSPSDPMKRVSTGCGSLYRYVVVSPPSYEHAHARASIWKRHA